jgi:eukaryotic-like serine/threonine-protein kinase
MFEGLLQNRYQIIQVLNRGGMAIIYLALDRRLNCQVAIKEICFCEETDAESDKILTEAFEQEAQLLAKLTHPAIPRSLDYFIENNNHYFVMEFVGGVDLERLMKRNSGSFEAEQINDWMMQLVDVLEYLHGQNPVVVHRDIKPSNIKINAKNQIRLLDFGIAKIYANEIRTQDSINFATLEYAPLEQTLKASSLLRNSLMTINKAKTLEVLRTQSSPKSDIFALGATLYRLATGKLPVDAHTRALALWSGKTDPLPAVSFYNSSVQPEFEAAVMQSLAIYPQLRPQTVSELRQKISSKPAPAPAPPAQYQKFPATKPFSQPYFGAFLQKNQELKYKVKSLEKELTLAKNSPPPENSITNFVRHVFSKQT